MFYFMKEIQVYVLQMIRTSSEHELIAYLLFLSNQTLFVPALLLLFQLHMEFLYLIHLFFLPL